MKIEDALVSIFGKDTIEYERYAIDSLDLGPWIIGGIPLEEAKEGFRRGFHNAITTLELIIDTFEENLSDQGESPVAIANDIFQEINLNRDIYRAAIKLFEDGHYANAIENAFKVLESKVKIRSGRNDLHGTDLMQTVFSPKNPILKFNTLQNDSEISEQQGMMFLYSGLISALRNPRAHNIIEDTPQMAIEIISFINLLVKALDKTQK